MATTTTRKKPAPRITKTGAAAPAETKPIIDIQIAPKAVEVVDQARIREMLNKRLVDDYGNVGSVALTSLNYEGIALDPPRVNRVRGALDLLVVHSQHGAANFRVQIDRAMKSGLTKAVSLRDGFDIFIPYSWRKPTLLATHTKTLNDIVNLFVKQIKEYYDHPMFKAAPPFQQELAQAASAADQIIHTAPTTVVYNDLVRKALAVKSNLETEVAPHYAESLKTLGGKHQPHHVFKVVQHALPETGVVLLKVYFALPLANGVRTRVPIGMLPVQFVLDEAQKPEGYLEFRHVIDKSVITNFNKSADVSFIHSKDVCVTVVTDTTKMKTMADIRDEVLGNIAYLSTRIDDTAVQEGFAVDLTSPSVEESTQKVEQVESDVLTAVGLAEIYKATVLMGEVNTLLTEFVKFDVRKTTDQHITPAVRAMRKRLSDKSAVDLSIMAANIHRILKGEV